MNSTNKKGQIPKGVTQLNRPPRHVPQSRPVAPPAAANRKSPTAPPVYRPQQVPKVLQAKKLSGVAQLMESRKRFYGKLGHLAQPDVADDIPVPRAARVERLYPVIREEEPEMNIKRFVNETITKLLMKGTVSGPPDVITRSAVETAKERLLGKLGGGGGDYGAKCRKLVPGLIELALDKGYDIRDARVLDLLATILVPMEGLGYTTTIGNFRGTWRGGGFG